MDGKQNKTTCIAWIIQLWASVTVMFDFELQGNKAR